MSFYFRSGTIYETDISGTEAEALLKSRVVQLEAVLPRGCRSRLPSFWSPNLMAFSLP